MQEGGLVADPLSYKKKRWHVHDIQGRIIHLVSFSPTLRVRCSACVYLTSSVPTVAYPFFCHQASHPPSCCLKRQQEVLSSGPGVKGASAVGQIAGNLLACRIASCPKPFALLRQTKSPSAGITDREDIVFLL